MTRPPDAAETGVGSPAIFGKNSGCGLGPEARDQASDQPSQALPIRWNAEENGGLDPRVHDSMESD